MKHILFLLLFVRFFCSPLFAQNRVSDSLINVIHAKKSDKDVLAAIIKLTKRTNDFDENIMYARNGLIIAEALKDSAAIGELFQNIAQAFYFIGNYDSTASYYYRSIEMLESKNAYAVLALTYNGLAKLFRKTGNYPRAHQFYDKAMDIFVSLKDKIGISMIYNESGVVYEYEKKYAEAIKNYRASLQISKQLDDQIGVSYALNFIAGVYVIQKKFKEAEDYNFQALAIREKLKDTFSISLMYTDIGNMYLQEKKFDKAEMYFQKSNQFANSIHFSDLMMDNYKALSNIALEKGNPQKALAFYKQSTALKDSIYKISTAQKVEELSAIFESVQKEKQIQEQQFAITKRNYWISGFVVLIILLSALSYSWYRRYTLKQQGKLKSAIITQQALATQAVIEAEENERKRIARDLHDGIGQMMSAAKMNLSAMEQDIHFPSEKLKNNFSKTVSLVDESCLEVRTVSHNMMPNALMATDFGEAITKFIDRIQNNHTHIQLHTEGLNKKMDANIESVLYRIIQECVNNVLKHAQATQLDISIIKDEDGINATIEDNGKGFDVSRLHGYAGIGLKNIERRINFLRGKVEWHSNPGEGTLVAIYVPTE